MSGLRTILALTLLITGALGLCGCPILDDIGAKRKVSAKLSLKRAQDNNYLAAQMKGRDGVLLIQIVNRDLRPPFRVEVTTGIFDPKRTTTELTGAIFGMELDSPGGVLPPPEFYGISMQFLTGQASVWSGSRASAPNRVGETTFPGTTQVDMAIEHDGTNVLFSARPAGTIPWTSLGMQDTTGRPFPVHPTIGVFQGRRPAEVGFDNFRIVSNGPRPGGLSAQDGVIEDIFEALDLQVDAGHKLDDPAIELSTLAAALDSASLALDGVQGDLIVLTLPGKKRRTAQEIALKNLTKGMKKLVAAQAKLEKGKSRKSIAKQIEKAVRLQYMAIYGLQQDSS